MIPNAYITEWQQYAPWSHPDMVEQDLVISRVLLELFGDEEISRRLAFRGGTALYKLFLLPAARYSEDVDLVQLDPAPIGPTLDRIRGLLDHLLGVPNYQHRLASFRLVYRFAAESDPATTLRLKLEINTRKHVGRTNIARVPFSIESRWISGSTEITTFPLEELLGTKLRALYQRKKGRDLFDLDYALRMSDLHAREVVEAFVEYVAADGLRITGSEFIANLMDKREDAHFRRDIVPLLRGGIEFDVDKAIDRIVEAFIQHIDAAWASR